MKRLTLLLLLMACISEPISQRVLASIANGGHVCTVHSRADQVRAALAVP
jgi:hypothetical protein